MKKILVNVFYYFEIIGIYFYYWNFSSLVKQQNLDHRKIPIVIISYNQLKNLKRLIDFLHRKEYENIIVLDNASTYPPLLQYLSDIEKDMQVIRMEKNFGHLVFWERIEISSCFFKGYYVVTDPDVLPVEDCPPDFLSHFKKLLDRNLWATKVGFSLKIDDLPDSNPNKDEILCWEKQYWQRELGSGNYAAAIDTTFALYRPVRKHNMNRFYRRFYRGIRTKAPYTARHISWYMNPKKMSVEQKYYMESANSSYSWKVTPKGELCNPKYRENA